MNVRPDEEEDEETTNGGAVTRKAWFAGHADSEHAISAAFRGVPGVPHGGAQAVTHADIAGSMEWCWCGQPFDHDWPGKDAGRNHPRKESEVTSTSTEEQPRIERRALRAYHADLADIILTAVNEYGTKYRLTAHSVILFPSDGSKPYAINARNGDRQVRGAKTWFVRHCVPLDQPIKEAKPAVSTKPVDGEAVKELAEMLNSEEHLPPADQPVEKPSPAMVATKKVAKKAAAKADPPQQPTAADFAGVQGVQPSDVAAATEPASDGEWQTYYTGKSKNTRKPSKYYVVNAAGDVKCTVDGWIGKPSGTGGHTRTHHTDTTTLWGPKAKEKGVQTYFTNKALGQVGEAIEMIQNALEIRPAQADTSAQDAEIKELKAKNTALSTELTDLKQKLADLEAKQALLRETLGL